MPRRVLKGDTTITANNKPPFTFTVDLAVIESLGINLYSNAAAVLSELVANAWDADANEVDIDWDVENGTVTIQDDGSGMTERELDERYLTVAYKKRTVEGTRSPVHDRPFMGRKGIGKLSVYSLANQLEVYSAKDGQMAGFEISLKDLRDHIEAGVAYNPDPATIPTDMPARGTRIVLKDLNSKRASVTRGALRRRLARRFDVLKFSSDATDRFVIKIDGEPIGYDDRGDLKRLQYIWQLGADEIPGKNTPRVKRRWLIPEQDTVVDEGRGWKLEGWFGTVNQPSELIDDEDKQESLRNIIILARSRPIQEGILDQLDFNKFFGNYVTGQIRAEFLDVDGADDIATSDRQRLLEDDDRVQLLLQKLRQLFNDAAAQWSIERPKEKFRQTTSKYPTMQEWVAKRPESQQTAARSMIGTIGALHLDRESDRPALYKAGVLAFERIAIEDTTRDLERFADGLFASDVLPLLATSRSYEDALYLQILRSRLEAIEKLEKLINKDELEKVLQEHLFDNLWLLDPSWEGAAGDADMEIALTRIRKGILFDKSEQENQKQGRIDIQYRSAAGVHMIVELKRYGRTTTLEELVEQGNKYHQALTEVIQKREQSSSGLNVVFVLGQKPQLGYLGNRTEEERIHNAIGHLGGRVLYYDQLLHNAQQRYREYRERKVEATTLDEVLASLDALIPDPAGDDAQ
ncbi:BbrUII/HgiDII family restriction enzyme [Curtobacterium sp. B18]|uniref:BbrUII/HgiDII family restriction enzyme n=1 Tax=Curtobacterium sp. B18 TaxID=95614 RepID=UPI00034D29CB|nr:ATP-binding protein [Curtobacterium sp. B18]